jgi:hypothetical protein
MSKPWIVKLEQCPIYEDDVILPFPPDLIAELGWTEGTELLFTEEPDGSIILRKAP